MQTNIVKSTFAIYVHTHAHARVRSGSPFDARALPYILGTSTHPDPEENPTLCMHGVS